jgi:hypothetical protein
MLPQRVIEEGGYHIKGKSSAESERLLRDAHALEQAGVSAIVLELVHPPLASTLTKELKCPTIGIGSGPDCDGQILVLHDVIGLFPWFRPKFAQPRADVAFEMYTGTCAGLTALTPSCYNASASRGLAETATITSGLSVGTTYYIRVYDRGPGYGSANGNITICVAPPPPPANDNCSGATVLAVGGSCTPTAGITISATQSQPAVACNGFKGNADDDVWYSFTVAANTLLDIQVTPTAYTFDPVVQLFTGNSRN